MPLFSPPLKKETTSDAPPHQTQPTVRLLPTMAPDIEAGREPSRLLRLPPHIRHRTYLRLGVARFDGYPNTYYLDGRKESRMARSDFDPPLARNFAGLLLSCRVLYAETAALLYSANRFVIFYSHHGSLNPLRALSPVSLASLTSLKIVLNQSSCHSPIDSYTYPPPCCDREQRCADDSCCTMKFHYHVHSYPLLDPSLDLDLASAEVATQPMLSEWYETATYISPLVGIGRLDLSLVCDIDPQHLYALSVGRLATAPIALFPQLKNCHIRLAKKWNRPLQQLAEEAVFQGCYASPHSPRPAKTSPALTTLPPELRQRILQYTDLITPWKEVTVSRQNHGYQLCRPPCTNEFGCPPPIHHGRRLVECDSNVDGTHVAAAARLPGCFCRLRHAAFSSICRCWAPPTSLFLVCHVLCRDAQFVFFSGNRFVVHDFDALMPWDLPYDVESYPYDRLFAPMFLRDIIPAHCLADLRFLELVFPPYDPRGWPGRAVIQDWSDTVDWIRGKVDAAALTISVVMADFHYVPDDVHAELTKDQGLQIIKGYSNVLYFLGPLARDDGLGGFHVQVAYPWRWTPENRQRHSLWLAEEEQRLKEYAERFVLQGKACSRNGRELRKSVWQRWYEVDPLYSAEQE